MSEETVFSHWQTIFNKPRAKMDEARRKAIRGRLRDGYSAEDLCDAISGCRLSDWHMGQNDRRQQYTDIALICRDAAHVDQFIELYERKKAKAEAAEPVPFTKPENGAEKVAELRNILRRA